MKKLYTLLLAAAVACTATATPFQHKKAAVKSDIQFTEAGTMAPTSIDLKKLGLSREDVATTVSRADLPTLLENFMLISSPDTLYTTFDTAPCKIYEDPTALGTGSYLIDNFIMRDTKTIDAEINFSTVENGGETIDIPIFTIRANTVLFEEDGVKYSLRLFGYAENQNGQIVPSIYKNDIEFIVLSDGSLTFAYNGNMGIAYVSPEMSGSWILAPDLLACNGSMTGVEAAPNAQSQMEYFEYSNDVWGQYSEEYKVISLANFADYGKLMLLDVDAANSTATAENQAVVDLYSKAGVFQGYLSSVGNDVAPVTFSVSTENGKTVIAQDPSEPAYVVVNQNDAFVMWRGLIESKITLDFEIPGLSGISNVTVADENAPVEYYNLQGVRVENPANGLYIKRQGKTATKVFVK